MSAIKPLTVFDTSALVAVLVANHSQHAWASAQMDKAELAGQVGVSTHTLAETYKVLTAHPQIGLSGSDAVQVLEQATQNYQKISLDDRDYFAVMHRLSDHKLSGSVIFDALIAQAALKAGASALATLNPKDFKRLGKDVAALLVHP